MNSSEDGKRVRLSLRDLEAYRGQGPGKKYGNKLRFYCPIHGSDHQRSLQVDPKTGLRTQYKRRLKVVLAQKRKPLDG